MLDFRPQRDRTSSRGSALDMPRLVTMIIGSVLLLLIILLFARGPSRQQQSSQSLQAQSQAPETQEYDTAGSPDSTRYGFGLVAAAALTLLAVTYVCYRMMRRAHPGFAVHRGLAEPVNLEGLQDKPVGPGPRDALAEFKQVPAPAKETKALLGEDLPDIH